MPVNLKLNRTTALSAIAAAAAVAAVFTYALGRSGDAEPVTFIPVEPPPSAVVKTLKLAQLPFDHPSWEPNEETKAWALKRAYELNGNKMCCGSMDLSREASERGIVVDPNVINPIDQEADDQEERRRQIHQSLKEVRRRLVDKVDPPKDDPCKHFHMHKVVTDGGASWKCKH